MSNFDKILEDRVADIQYLTVNYVINVLQNHRAELIEFLYPNPDHLFDKVHQQEKEKEATHFWGNMSPTDRKKTIAFACKLY